MKTTCYVLLVFVLFATYDASNQRASGIEERNIRVRRSTSVRGDIAMCYDCDDKCVAYIKQFSDDVYDYFDDLTTAITQIFVKSGFPLTFSVRRVRLLHQDVSLSTYVSESDTNKMNAANNNYWNFNFEMLQSSEQCDVGLFTSRDDFFTTENFGGFATYLSMCTKFCYGLIELTNNINTLASRISHELGHTLGLYHYDKSLPEFLQNVTSVKTACQTNECQDPTGRCVMLSYLASPPPQRFATCARAMFDHWASTHDTACIESPPVTTVAAQPTTASPVPVTDATSTVSRGRLTGADTSPHDNDSISVTDPTTITASTPMFTSTGTAVSCFRIFQVVAVIFLLNVW